MRKYLRIICLTLIVLLILPSCATEWVPLTASEFQNMMRENGLEVLDFTADMGMDGPGEVALFAFGKNGLVLEFYVMADAAQAQASFEGLKQDMQIMTAGENSQASNVVAGKNYQKIELQGNGRFGVVCQVAHTLLYVNTEESNREHARDLIKTMDY